ncbi:MAG: bifunctional diaminohydroxyphosphoribosylaminopyrimidine deaminase/5-amino-6-(5-phosphoribosylamino)uracil reductase RibD [Candidatus Micrarchaeota archaeon]
MGEEDAYMRLALKLAQKADPFPNPRVGAVLVKGERILGTGYHRKPGMPHAEMEAIGDAKRRAGHNAARGATLYVTLEPCSHTIKRTPPCTSAIIANGIKRVVFAMKDPNPLVCGKAELEEAGVEVTGPVDEERAAAINKKYTRNILKRPLVAMKMAMSADGKTATKTGDSKWISGRSSRGLVHRMRSRFDAVMVGAGTVAKDDPRLTSHGIGRNPYRVIVDGRLRIPLDADVLRNPDGKTIVAVCGRAPENKIRKLRRRGVGVFCCGKAMVDMRRLLLGLGAMGMKKIMIEGGSELNANALEAGIVDKLYLFIAPRVIGGRDAKGVIGGKGIEKIKEALPLANMRVRKVGRDLFLEADVSR